LPRTRTTKKLAQRIDLDYFKRPSPLRRWRFLLSVAAPAFALLGISWYGVRSDPRVYSAGSLSTAHAVLTKQCSACHSSNLGFYDKKVIDQKCLTCHDGPLHHKMQAFTPSCSACHSDHRGAIRLAATRDTNCTQCHADLATRGNSTSYVRNIGSFESNHPEFAVLRSRSRDPGNIQLNHYLHLQPNLFGPNGSHVQMVCTDCHRSAADAAGRWPYGDSKSRGGTSRDLSSASPTNESSISAPSRAYMAPATYAQTCAGCHTLHFDKRLADAVPHDKPEVIHSFVVSKLRHIRRSCVCRAILPATCRNSQSPRTLDCLGRHNGSVSGPPRMKRSCGGRLASNATRSFLIPARRFPKSPHPISPRAICRTQISITRNTALWTARVATPPQRQASKVPTCFYPASRRAAPATIPAPKRRNRAASNVTPTTTPPSASPRTAVFP
jgi:hypothetical protein